MNVPLSSVCLSELEKSYVRDAVETGWISGTGKYLQRFEAGLAERIGRRHVIAVANGTVALELALLGLNIGPGDEVIVPALTFAAPAAAVHAVGAAPVFADITFESWTIDVAEAARLMTPRTKAVIAVDLLGHPCDFERVSKLGVPVIEDAAQAHGALYKDMPVGSFGEVSTFSFHANKTISTGEGGCVATDNSALVERMRLIANHGMTRERPYWHPVVGHNFRMTNLTAAIGTAQVERWNELVSARKRVAELYDHLLAGVACQRRPLAPWATEACWLYTVAVDDRSPVVTALRASGIDARGLWTALPELPVYAGSRRGTYEVARRVSETALWLPTWAGMPKEAVRQVVDALRAALDGGASR
jgi:perosamine synthetase